MGGPKAKSPTLKQLPHSEHLVPSMPRVNEGIQRLLPDVHDLELSHSHSFANTTISIPSASMCTLVCSANGAYLGFGRIVVSEEGHRIC